MTKPICLILLCALPMVRAMAQDSLWTLSRCLQYAVQNSPVVKKKHLASDNYRAGYQEAVAAFFPSLGLDVSAQYSYGRSIDPETNTYVNTSSFNNGYGASVSLPLFDGGQTVNRLRLARVNRQAGLNDIRQAEEALALNTLLAYVDVMYYHGALLLAAQKLDESNRIHYKTRRMEELGLKGAADVAQTQAQAAADDYNLTHQQNLYRNALLTLKEGMNFPADKELRIDTVLPVTPVREVPPADAVFLYAQKHNPIARQAEYQLRARKLEHLAAKGTLFPTVSFQAGVSTNYFKNLQAQSSNPPPSFQAQLKNNRGEYFMFNLSIPLFNRLTRVTGIRRARNEVQIARQTQSETLYQLRMTIEKALQDRQGYRMECIRMEQKCLADSLAYRTVVRKYEEGLMSPLDVITSANTLLLSRAEMLRTRLMHLLKCKEVDYYNGIPLIN